MELGKNGGLMKSFKTRIYPTDEQKEYFHKCFGIARFTYNMALGDYQNNLNKFNNMKYQKYINNEINASGKYPWLYEVNSMVRQEALKDLKDSISLYNTMKKKNDNPKEDIDVNKFKPRFRSKKRTKNSFSYNNKSNPLIYLSDKFIRLVTVNGNRWNDTSFKIKSKESIKFLNDENNRLATVTISETNERYYISISYEKINYKENRKNSDSIGIDMNMTTPLVCIDSNGQGFKFQIPESLRIQEKKTERIQRILSRKRKFSNEFYKIKKRLKRSYEREANIMDDYRHKISLWLVQNYKNVNYENFRTGFKKGQRSNYRFGRYDFVQKLEYKSEIYSNNLQKISGKATTQTCSQCGHRFYKEDKLMPGDKWYDCPDCGVHLDRDYNAAKNILDLKYV